MTKYNNKKPNFKSGDTVKLNDDSTVILSERWDNNRVSEISWKAFRSESPDKIFTITENEIPNQN